MPLLARSTRRTPREGAPAPGPQIVRLGRRIEVSVAGVPLQALPEGALWIETSRALVVSDLHLEKASAFAKAGQMLPPYDTHATLERLAALVAEQQPDIVVSLGDAFHDAGGPARMGDGERQLLEHLITRVDWVWVEGNHDGRSAETLGGAVRTSLQIEGLSLRHEPTGEVGEIAGHLHPCARVSGRGGSVRRRCFAYDGARMVMPAFGAYTGGLNVCDEAFDAIFSTGVLALVLGKDRVLPAPPSRLLAD